MIKGFIVSQDVASIGYMTKYTFKYIFSRIRRLRNTAYGDITHKTYRVHDRDARTSQVLEKSGGEPVAVLKNSALVGYFVPAEAISNEAHRTASMDEIKASLVSRSAITRPVLDYLKDK